mgnify:CR=1 FL=1
MVTSSEEKKTCDREICFISFTVGSVTVTLRIKILLDIKLHVLFREVETHVFPDGQPKYQLQVRRSDGVHKILVESSTPRTCWDAKPGQDYKGTIDILPYTASDEEYEDDPYLTW